MPRTSYYTARISSTSCLLFAILLLATSLPVVANAIEKAQTGEILSGFYSRDGNNGSPSKTSGNSIYIKFFEDRWVGVMFIPYPYAIDVEAPVITKVFDAARRQASSAALMKGKFELLDEAATLQIERYGYLEDRIVFECGSLSPCTIKLGEASLELIKPGVINEHIIKYNHVATP